MIHVHEEMIGGLSVYQHLPWDICDRYDLNARHTLRLAVDKCTLLRRSVSNSACAASAASSTALGMMVASRRNVDHASAPPFASSPLMISCIAL